MGVCGYTRVKVVMRAGGGIFSKGWAVFCGFDFKLVFKCVSSESY